MRAPNRRQFLQGSLALAGLGLLSGCGLLPPQVEQRTRVPRIGFVSSVGHPELMYDGFRAGLGDLGYVEGRNVVIEYRDIGGRLELIPAVTSELLNSRVDIIVAAPSSIARAIREVADTQPIVVAYGDPLAQGLVASLAHPGGNVTGLSSATAEISAKRLELLREAVPGLSRVALLWQASSTEQQVSETETAARLLGLHLQVLTVRDAAEFVSAFAAMSADRAEALVVLPGPLFGGGGEAAVVDLAGKQRLPTMFESRGWVDAGGLMAYGPNLGDLTRRSAAYVDKILKGTKPGDLAVELPTEFDFVINLKTARDLGLTIPPSVLAQATEVIQ